MDGYLIDAFTRHQLLNQRFATGQIDDVLPILRQLSKDLQARILTAQTDFQVYRLERLLRDVNQIVIESNAAIQRQLILNLTDFAQYEAEFTHKLLSQVVNVELTLPAPEQIAGVVTQASTRLVSGKDILTLSLPQMLEQFSRAKAQQIGQIIRAGFIEGATQQQMASQVKRLVSNTVASQLGSLIRTASNHIATQARKRTYQENRDVIDREEWVSTLDNRTSLTCQGLDGKIWPVGEGIYPPAHFGCRSVRVPKVKELYQLDIRGNERASMFGPVSAQRTYGGWLKDQSKEFQDEVLGPERAKLFRTGKISIDRFTDDFGRIYTLEELRRLEPLAFGG